MDNHKYFLYARKSSESEDRQVASIESQISELRLLAKQEGLEIINIFSESKSAKAPGRPIFNQMMSLIARNKAQGILCWKLDRLARNFIDGGLIIDLLQKSTIQSIRTYERVYSPNDNVLMMAVEFGMANQFIRDLSANTKRGMLNKANNGWHPGRAPIGYLNDKNRPQGQRTIIKDPERFDIVRKMWDHILEKGYSIERIFDIAVDKWNLTLFTGKKPCRSKIYEVFKNPFYYGYFYYAGKLFKGSHEPMITKEEFDKAQDILSNRAKPQPKKHYFAFTQMIRCGECGAMITAENRIKRQKNGNCHYYTYYHCTRKIKRDCSQEYIEEKELEKQIIATLEQIQIPQEFHEWAIEQLKTDYEHDLKGYQAVLEGQKRALASCSTKLDNLLNMRICMEINEEDFLRKKDELLHEKIQLEELLRKGDQAPREWLDRAIEIFSFAKEARNRFVTGNLEDKKQILAFLGSNLSLKDKLLTINLKKPFFLIKEINLGVKQEFERFEPHVLRRKTGSFLVQKEVWGG